MIAAIGAFATSPACGTAGDEPDLTEPASFTEIEQALCRKLVQCGCGESFVQAGLVPPLSCDGWTLEDLFADDDGGYYYGYGYEEGGDYAEPLSVAVDEECLHSFAQRIEELDCNLYLSEAPDCRSFCSPFVGPRHAGEPCSSQFDCSRGLRCAYGECRDPCAIAAPSEGQPCESRDDCDRASQVCTSDQEGGPGRCISLPGVGQSCYFEECAPGVRCDDGECVSPTPDGAACMGHRECASSYCPAGYCSQAPGVGQECGADGACASGSECVAVDDGPGTCSAFAGQCIALIDAVSDLALPPFDGF